MALVNSQATSENPCTRQYALYGALFGLCFPLGSTVFQAMVSGPGLSLEGLAAAQALPMLWVIDSAPFWLGLFAAAAGRRQDELDKAMRAVMRMNVKLEDTNHALEASNTHLATANDEIRLASKLKSEFLANMSHELRTPLNAIIGFSRILIRKTEELLPARQAKNLVMVHESGQHLLELVNDMLDIERIEAGMITVKPTNVDVVDMTRDVVAKHLPAAKAKGLALAAITPDDPVLLRSDEVRLRQLLDNLVNNAIKYSDAGSIVLELEVCPERDPDHILFVVTDEGRGIPEGAIEHIFDPFRQVDGSSTRAQGGVGLGLHLAKRISELLHGDISVRSDDGHGSTFTVRLLAKDLVTDEDDESSVIDNAPAGSGPLLLIIDDTASSVELMRAELVEAGFRVHAAMSGKEGLAKAETIRPDVILLDIIMPEMDGWAVLKTLRGTPTLCDTPVVITSLLDDSPHAYELGVIAWLTKPFTSEQFHDAIRNLRLGGHEDVLVVEDDPATAALLLEHLTDMDLAVRLADDGRKAVAMIDDRLPRAVILDIMLPHVDGFGVLEHLRSRDGGLDVPVLVYTAKDLSSEERSRLRGKILDVVRKGDGHGPTGVVDMVRRVLDRTSGDEEPK